MHSCICVDCQVLSHFHTGHNVGILGDSDLPNAAAFMLCYDILQHGSVAIKFLSCSAAIKLLSCTSAWGLQLFLRSLVWCALARHWWNQHLSVISAWHIPHTALHELYCPLSHWDWLPTVFLFCQVEMVSGSEVFKYLIVLNAVIRVNFSRLSYGVSMHNAVGPWHLLLILL